jgi:hypothetical protein
MRESLLARAEADRLRQAADTGSAAAPPPPPTAVAETMAVARAAPPPPAPPPAPPRPTLIVSPDSSTRWLAAASGSVQRSTDGGATWETQATGVTAMPTAGASPSPSVCWLVGPAGLVLITTDGRSWQRVPFPEIVDLVAIAATDDRTATVTAVDGRTFTTGNRGEAWER